MRKTHLTLPLFQLLVTLKSGPLSASDMIDRLRGLDDRGRAPSLASFYRNVKRALDAGLIRAAGGDVKSTGGRPSQLYELTKPGHAAMQEAAVRLRGLAEAALAPDPSRSRRANA